MARGGAGSMGISWVLIAQFILIVFLIFVAVSATLVLLGLVP
jgi:hypothetical protein